MQVLFEKTRDLKGVGILVVRTEPSGGEVFVDGKAAGVSPATIDNVVPGDHVVTAKKEGLVGTADVRVLPSTVERVTVTLRAGPPVKVKILSTPPDAVAFLDGVRLGPTPVMANDVQAGPHQLRLEADGFHPYDETIVLSRDEYERGGEVPLAVEVKMAEHVTLIGVPVGLSLGLAADGRDLGEGVSFTAELFIAPWSWLEIGLGINTPPLALITLRFPVLQGGFELGPLVRLALIQEAPAGGDGAFAVSGGLFAGYLFETGLGEAGARFELLANRELKGMVEDLWTVPMTLVAVWRI